MTERAKKNTVEEFETANEGMPMFVSTAKNREHWKKLNNEPALNRG
jgi:hypothetical protein